MYTQQCTISYFITCLNKIHYITRFIQLKYVFLDERAYFFLILQLLFKITEGPEILLSSSNYGPVLYEDTG